VHLPVESEPRQIDFPDPRDGFVRRLADRLTRRLRLIWPECLHERPEVLLEAQSFSSFRPQICPSVCRNHDLCLRLSNSVASFKSYRPYQM